MSETISGGTLPPPAPNANPDCPHKPDYSLCRVTRAVRVQEPVIEWEPIYDGSGQMTNADPNTHISTFQCATCIQGWEVTWVAGSEPAMRKKL